MPTLPQLGDSENNLLAKTVNNTGPNQPVHGDGRWNLLYKLCQNTYEAAVRNNIIDGEVQTYYDLPITQGNPPLQSVYLALEAVGVPLINRHPAGLYARTQNAGSLSDFYNAILCFDNLDEWRRTNSFLRFVDKHTNLDIV